MLNPNLDAIARYFAERSRAFFHPDGSPRAEFFDSATCYNCGDSATESEFHHLGFRHVRCQHCGMVYVSPRLQPGRIEEIYSTDVYDQVFRLKVLPALEYRRDVIGRRKVMQIEQRCSPPGRVLDVGCGVGDLLSVFREHGWDVTGVEINHFAASFARHHFGLDVFEGSIFDFEAEAPFDCVMMWGVLEHFVDPMRLLKKALELAKPGGLLVLEVPSGDSLLVRYVERSDETVDRILEGDRHLMLFSVRSLHEMIEKAGFERSEILTNGLDIDTICRVRKLSLEGEVSALLQSVVDQAGLGDLLRAFAWAPLEP